MYSWKSSKKSRGHRLGGDGLADSLSALTLVDGAPSSERSPLGGLLGSIISGFQLATSAGPLCAEPMCGVGFSIEDIQLLTDEQTDSEWHCIKLNIGLKLGLLSGQMISTMREACRLSFLTWSPRLMLAMYSCDLQAPGMG